MFIEAVTVCNQYSDFLSWTIRQNKQFFDGYIVVTSNKDKNTINLCQDANVRCLQTNAFEDGNNKARAINLGLNQLSRKGFIVQIDADIYLPNRTRQLLEWAKLDSTKIYGCDRLNVKGFNKWIEYLSNPGIPFPIYQDQIYLHLGRGFDIGARVIKTWREPDFKNDLGYFPLGYFQLWSEPDGVPKFYPEINKDYSRSDMEHSGQWSRDKRELIPELICLHLMGENDTKSINWGGRKSPKFGPKEDAI